MFLAFGFCIQIGSTSIWLTGEFIGFEAIDSAYCLLAVCLLYWQSVSWSLDLYWHLVNQRERHLRNQALI